MDIHFGEIGKIARGDYAGWEVVVRDDREGAGGFSILVSRDFYDKDAEAYDDWVEKEEYLSKYFDLSSWVVEWTGTKLPPL